MMKQLCSMLLMVTISLCALGQNHQDVSVYFETAKHNLTADSKTRLDDFSTNFPSLDDYAVEILAHTDSRGSDTYNKALANRRAASVQKYLTEKGLHIQKVSINSFGENNPKYTNTTEEGRQGNRRVDLIIKAMTFETVSDVISKLTEQKRQTFTISADQEEIIKGEAGTIITVPADAFEFEDGSGIPTGEVQVHLEEAYSFGDLIAMDMPTISDGKMLQTGGSLKITATSQGKDLKLKSDKSINIKMPSTDKQDDMELFIGERNDAGNMNWKSTNEPFKTIATGMPVEEEEQPFRRQVLPVVLDEDGTIDRTATNKLYSEREKLDFPMDYAPLYERGINRDPVIKGYVPKPLADALNEHWDAYPKNNLKKPEFYSRVPKKPTYEDVKYNPKGVEKMKLGKKGIEAKRKEIYEKKLVSYKKRLERYEMNKANYDRHLEAYNTAIKEFRNVELASWQSKLDSLMEDASEYVVINDQYAMQKLLGQSKEDRIESFEARVENGSKIGQTELFYYVQDINQLGYINCDKFLNFPLREQAPLMVKKGWEDEKIMVIVQKYKSLINAYNKGGYYTTPNIPVNVRVTILGLKTKDDQVYLGKLETKTNGTQAYELDYKPISISELKKELSMM